MLPQYGFTKRIGPADLAGRHERSVPNGPSPQWVNQSRLFVLDHQLSAWNVRVEVAELVGTRH